MKAYKYRISDEMLLRKLAGKGAVLIDGPKWCGKTTTAKRIAKSTLMLGKTSVLLNTLDALDVAPEQILLGAVPRLFDEWQTIPEIWDMIRSEVDERGEPGQFILTGSSVLPEAYKTVHSGTGRISRLKMRTMSLFESGESNGKVSLGDLFDGGDIDVIPNELDLDAITFLICRGGWPAATFLSEKLALDQALDYYDAITEIDIKRVDNTRRSPERAKLILHSYARNLGHQVPYSTICQDIKSNDSQNISDETVKDYVDAFKKLFTIEDMPSWNPNLRSKTIIRTSDNRYFMDPSIATAALGIGPNDLKNDLKACGMFFENLVVRDLRIYADKLDGKLYHYRDSNGLECDTVLHRRNGQYALIEIKLGGNTKIEEAARSINSLRSIIDTQRMNEPSFCMIVTAVGQYAYRRKDGIFVVPIACLKP